jgi:hypothetical protein
MPRHPGCSPVPKASICSDVRFSCPTGTACNMTALACTDGTPLLGNVASTKTTNAAAGSVCELISMSLPSFCGCKDEALGGVMSCEVNMLGIETVGVFADLLPCALPAKMSFEVTSAATGIKFGDSVELGTTTVVPVPGLTLGIPFVATAQVQVNVDLQGSVAAMEVDLALDACADLAFIGKKCGSDLTSGLPIGILKGGFSFSGLCS